ncbi:50S ribosomal protein L20 [Candidatus Marinamargulisbacteria bacterium SCGC AG-343-D04]|nr:50S ribosomal protein L20 [Candidatus Marinamargulisbacteria bacterium SCGC AG-343-D04]
MSRVKRGNVARKRRKKVLKLAKGFSGSLSKLYRPAQQAVLHAGIYAYKDRKLKKREFRKLWILRINAALNESQLSYSTFMGMCKKKNVQLNRKVLAELAANQPDVFNLIVKEITQ